MKSILTGFILFCAFASNAQVTTQAEYNYMKYGFRDIIEKGVDIKRGYSFEPLFSNKANIKFSLLKRKNGSYAGTIVEYITETSSGKTSNFYVIPAVTIDPYKPSFGWDQFNQEVNTMDPARAKVILSEFAKKAIPATMSKYYNKRLRRLDNR